MKKRWLGLLSLSGLVTAVVGATLSLSPAPCAYGAPCNCGGPVKETYEAWGTGTTCGAAKTDLYYETLSAALGDCPADICNSTIEYTNPSAPDCQGIPGLHMWVDGIRHFQCCIEEP